MGTLDHFWSFKLLLQDKQEQEEEAEVDSDPGSAMPRPFLAEAGRNQRTTKPDGENVLMAQYLQSAWPETVTAPNESTKVVPNQEAPRASPPPPPEVEFVPPTKKQLDGLTIFELRKLRREIA